MTCEEEIMSENEDCENSSCGSFTSLICTGNAQIITQMCQQPQNHLQHANLLLEDPPEKSWTDEKHSLYLNSIEEAFVSSLYQEGYYTYPCKRLQADRVEAACVFSSTDLNEEVESGFSNGYEHFACPEESQSESEFPIICPNVQNRSKRCRLKDICCSNETSKEQDMKEKRKRRKVQEEVQCGKHNHGHASNFYRGQTQNRNVSETIMKIISNNQEDQVVPFIDDIARREDGRP